MTASAGADAGRSIDTTVNLICDLDQYEQRVEAALLDDQSHVDVDPSTLPAPISYAALLTVQDLYRKEKEGLDVGPLVSRRIADTTETFAQAAQDVAASGLPGGAVTRLRPYRQLI